MIAFCNAACTVVAFLSINKFVVKELKELRYFKFGRQKNGGGGNGSGADGLKVRRIRVSSFIYGGGPSLREDTSE